jgi:hypothetical protein
MLPAIAVVVIVVVFIAIIVVANPAHGTIAIADTIAIAAPGWRIVGSVVAMALLFLGDCDKYQSRVVILTL